MKTITIDIVNGLAELSEIPDGLRVIVRDYDIEGVDETRLDRDEDGLPCFIEVYE